MNKMMNAPAGVRRVYFLILLTITAMLAFTLWSRPQAAQTTPARIAVIDVNKVLVQSNAGKAAYTRLKTMQDQKVAQASQMSNEIDALKRDIDAKKLLVSEAQINDMQRRLSDKQTAMQRFAQDADKEVAEARDKAMTDLNEKIMPIVDAMGKEMGLAAVFNKFESGLIYASDAIDITNTVVSRFNASVPAE